MPINLSKLGRRAIHVRTTNYRLRKDTLNLMRFFPLLAAAVLTLDCLAAAANPLTVVNLRCEYKTNPVGIDASQPRFSWELVNPQRATVQTAYQIRVAASQSELEKNDLWTSGRQPSDVSIQVAYQGPALSSGKRYYWQVVVWDNHGNSSGWSRPQYWEMGLLQPSDWQAHWISPNLAEDFSKSNPSPMLRHEFRVPKAVASAGLYASAMGLYELHLNGQRVGGRQRLRELIPYVGVSVIQPESLSPDEGRRSDKRSDRAAHRYHRVGTGGGSDRGRDWLRRAGRRSAAHPGAAAG